MSELSECGLFVFSVRWAGTKRVGDRTVRRSLPKVVYCI